MGNLDSDTQSWLNKLMNKVFNIGFSKSGTTSFETAMEVLGYKVYRGDYRLKHNDYMMALWIHKDFEEIRRMTTYWDAFADAPWGGTDLYKQLIKWYPNAKFVYTIRDPEKWYESLYKMLTRYDDNPTTALDTYHKNERYGFTYFLKQTFGITNLVDCKEQIIRYYENHLIEAKEFFKNNTDNFLTFDPINGDDWNRLCPFLGLPIPNDKYPHDNQYVPIKSDNSSLSSKIKNKISKLIK